MRRAVLTGAIIAVVLALALGGAVLYLNSSFGKRHLLRIVNEKALASAGLELGWSDVRGSFLYNFVARDPYLISAEGDTFITAETIRVRARPRSVLEGDIELIRVELDRPVVDIMALPDTRQRRLAESERETEAEADSTSFESDDGRKKSAVRIGNIVLRDGRVRWSRPGVASAAEGVTLRGSITFGGGADFQLDVSRFRGVLMDWGLRVEDLQGQIIMNRNLLWFIDNEVKTRDSILKANGNLDLSRGGRAGNLFLDLEADDLSEYWPIIGGDWAGEGSLHLTGRMRGAPDEPEVALTGAGELSGVELDRFDIRAAYMDDEVTADLSAVSPVADLLRASVTLDTRTGAGRLVASGRGLDLEGSPAALQVRSGRFDIDCTTDSFDPVSDGGRLLLSASGSDLYGLGADSLAVDLEVREGEITLLAPLRLTGAGYVLSTDGSVSLERGAALLDVGVTTTEPSGLLNRLGIEFGSGAVTLEARISGALDDPSLRGEISANGLQHGDVMVGASSFDFNIAQILTSRIGTFFAWLETVHVDPNLDLDGALLDGRIRGEEVTLQLVTGWWEGGDVNLHGNITVDSDSIRARIDSGRLVHRELDISNLAGQLAFDPETGAGPFSMNLRTAGGTARLSGARSDDQTLTFAGDLQRIAIEPITRTWLDTSVTIDGRVSGTIAARITQHLDEMAVTATVSSPAIGEYRYETLALDASYDQGLVVIEDLTITGEEGEGGEAESAVIRGDFRLPLPEDENDHGALDLTGKVESLRLDSFARYFDGTLRGTLSSDLAVGGTFSVPEIRGQISLVGAQVDTFIIEDMEAVVSYRDERLYLENGRIDAQGFGAQYTGSIPMTVSLLPATLNVNNDEQIEARLTGEGPPDFLDRSLGNQIEQIEGTLYSDIILSGTLSAPSLNGSFRWSDGMVKPAMLGQPISDIDVEVTLTDQVITIERFTGRMASDLRQAPKWWNVWNGLGVFTRKELGGDFSISGNVLLREGERPLYDLHLEGDEMGLSDPTGSVLVAVDADVALRNATGRSHPILDGTVQVQKGLADLGMVLNMIGSGGREATEAEVERTGLEADIEIEIPGRLRVIGGEFGQDVDIELMGNLIVRKSSTGSPYVLGTLEGVPGRGHLTIFGYPWAVDEGTVTFGSIEEINPNLNARFSATVQDLIIYLDLTGTLLEPQTYWSTAGNELTSQSAIIELLTFGTIGISGQGDGTEVIGNYLERAASRTVREFLPINEVELEGLSGLSSGLLSEDLQVSVGLYFTRRVYAKYARALGGQTLWSEYGVEYRFSRRFSLSGMRDRTGRYLFEVKWRIDY